MLQAQAKCVTINIAQEKCKVAPMLQGKIRSVFVAVLLLTFIGQGLAAASSPCKSMAPKSAQLEQAESTGGCAGHSESTSNNSANSTDISGGCPHCDCNPGGCSAIALAVASQAVIQTRLSVLADGYVSSTSSHHAPSLFRPPIAL